MKFKIKTKNQEYEVEISEKEKQTRIAVNDQEFYYDKKGGEAIQEINVCQASLPKRDFSKKEIRSILSGTISEIFVKEGEIIKPGQKLLTLSAMKMENEIVSDYEGKIKEISVKSGQKVKEGDKLIALT